MGAFGTIGIFVLAALCEIIGCFAVWAWMRNDSSSWWLLPGSIALALFAWLLTKADAAFAGRAFAAYGGVYIAASLAWMVLIEHGKPNERDLIGVGLCLAGAAVILSSGIKI